MKHLTFPTSASAASDWARRFGEPEELAVRRWIKFAALDSLARDPAMSEILILRGSVALSFYDPTNRLGLDIDLYTRAVPPSASPEVVGAFADQLNKVMHTWLPVHFPELDRWAAKIRSEIKLEVMRLECDVRWQTFRLPIPSNRPIRVAVLECLIAEKLIAILHEALMVSDGRKTKSRSRDVFDLAHLFKYRKVTVDLRLIHYHFDEQNALKFRPFKLERISFDERARLLAASKYIGKTHEKDREIPFDEAWECVLSLVDAASRFKTLSRV